MVSIIVVNYKVERELMTCVSSILKSKPKVKFEIVVVDNDEESKLGTLLKEKFPKVKYVKSSKNVGFGAGNNLGCKYALGEFLFFLNPDTIVEKGVIDILFNFVRNNPKSGMVAPLLIDPSGKAYPYQGSNEYDFKSALVTGSFLNKLFPDNPVSKNFFHKNWNKKETEEFGVVPGTAFMISKSLFEKAGMFDERFFLYFEEYDLAKRVRQLGCNNYIVPQAIVTHIWEASAKKRNDINKIFSESRFLFFKKHYGIFLASLINLISNFGKYEFIVSLILVITVFLGIFRIRELMPFIGDQGWFYLSARDTIINGQIPLVGIASSHPWLHQGPFWTYLLVPFLWLFNFDPVSGAYLTVILGVLSVAGIYVAGSVLFSKRTGLIASFLYATSPLVVYYMRFPYHTSPIPLFVIILTLFLHKVILGKISYFPLAILTLAVLYNFEIATVSLWGVLVAILIYKFFKNKKDFGIFFNKKNIFLSFISLLIPLFPIILYDIRNGFPQTLKFGLWSLYRAASLLGYNPQQAFSINKIMMMFSFLFNNFTKLIFAQSNLVSLIILLFLTVWIAYSLKRKEKDGSQTLILLLFLIPLALVVLNQVPSDAYLPIFFPTVILLFSSFLNFIMDKKRIFLAISIFLMILSAGNANFMLKNKFTFDESSKYFTLDRRLQATRQILKIVQKRDYNLKGTGPGSEFESFTMNYEYLALWLGHGPSKISEDLKIYVSESAMGIKIDGKK